MYIIIDLEATCWEHERNENEIIEIGAGLLKKKGHKSKKQAP